MKLTNIFAIMLIVVVQGKAIASGSSVRGGGNTVNHLLVEDYAVYPTELPNFDEVDKFLKIFGAKVPDFEKKMRAVAYPTENDLNAVQWYYIPKKLQELPVVVTGLTFSTDQTAFQQDDEIFVSEADLGPLAKEVKGRLYLHEILMMIRPNKEVGPVRKMMTFLKSKNYNPSASELTSALAQLGFGTYTAGDSDVEPSFKKECGALENGGIEVRIKDCRSMPGSLVTTKSNVIWRLVSRKYDRVNRKFNEVWKDFNIGAIWGDTLNRTYLYKEVIEENTGKQLACASAEAATANVNISERPFVLPNYEAMNDALRDGFEEIFPNPTRAYFIKKLSGTFNPNVYIEERGYFFGIPSFEPQSVRCMSYAPGRKEI